MADIPDIQRSDTPNGNRGSTPGEPLEGTPEAPQPASGPDESDAPVRRPSGWMQPGRVPDAFWKTATLFSFAINLGLVIAVIVLALMVFQIKNAIAQPLVGGLHTSFVQIDAAHIITNIQVVDTIHVKDTIHVNDTLPVVFNVPLATNTTVTLTRDIPIHHTTVYLNGLPVPTDIVLPAGTPLDINLQLIVPVSQTVPVVLDVPVNLSVPINLNVPVDIPLNQTQLHQPFTSLANLVGPYDAMLNATPSSWSDLFRLR